MSESHKKVIILQRVIPTYRVAIFQSITANKEFDIKLIIGDDLEGAHAKNASDLTGIRYHSLPSSGIHLMGRTLTHHHGLLKRLKIEQPDVVICEAESHFLGYVTAVLYKIIFSNRTKLIFWCFFALPGLEHERSFFHSLVKRFFRKFFEGFLSYSTFGKNFLISKGFNKNKITVAVNVCDTALFLRLSQELRLNKNDAKNNLGVGGKFVVTYVGRLDPIKRPDLLLDISSKLDRNRFQFFIVGAGAMGDELASQVRDKKLNNVTLTGRLAADLSVYYRASDIIVIPGRGGIVISEAMCFGIPVIVHQADGVEYDLVIPSITGTILDTGNANEFSTEIKRLSDCELSLNQMGLSAKNIIVNKYNTESMSNSIIQAIKCALT